MGLKWQKTCRMFSNLLSKPKTPSQFNSDLENGEEVINAHHKNKTKEYIKEHTSFKAGDFIVMVEGWEYKCVNNHSKYCDMAPLSFNDGTWKRTTECNCRTHDKVNIQIGIRSDAYRCIEAYLNKSQFDTIKKDVVRGNLIYTIAQDGIKSRFRVDIENHPTKKACIACGFCIGWDMDVKIDYSLHKGYPELKETDIGEYLMNYVLLKRVRELEKEQLARAICEE